MNFKLFSSIVKKQTFSDEDIESAFYIFFTEVESDDKKVSAAIELLKEHRPEIASKVAQKIVQQTPDEMIEEIINLLAKDGDKKRLAFYIISIWDIHPKIAEKMDEKYSLRIKAVMAESELLERYK